MKNLIFSVLLAFLYVGAVAQPYNMCSSTSTTDASGTFYDSGGSAGAYNNNENCSFLISPSGGCVTDITLTFNSVDIESGWDFLDIYDGTNSSGTLLISLSTSTPPAPIVATSGSVYFEFTSDGSVTRNGWDISWASTSGGTAPITSSFTASNTNPAYGETVQFTDNSNASPISWYWDFGDGSFSTQQNPSHLYTTSGTYNASLVATNCNYSDTSIQSIVAQPSPTVSISPNPINVNLSCGDSVVEYITVLNTGSVDALVLDGIIGGGGVEDSSTVTYTTTGAQTVHNFNISNTGIDTLFFWVSVNGDYDGGIGANEYISDVSVDGISLGIAGTQSLTIGNWDSTLFFMVDPDLSTVLADGMISVTVQSGSGVNTGFTNALDQHHVRVFTNGEGWLTGDVNPTTIAGGDSLLIPVTFHSFGLAAGTYNSTIVINTNDSANSSVQIPVTMNLSGTADYNLSESCLNFGTVIQGTTNELSLFYTNTGCADLFISNVTIPGADYTVLSYDNFLGIGQTGEIVLQFVPGSVGNFDDILTITTSVQDTTVCVQANAGPPPIIRVEPDPLLVDLDCGDSTVENITIYNDGGSDLLIENGVIGGGGVEDSSTVTYTTTGAQTVHNFSIANTGIDTLFFWVSVNGDYDGGIGANEYISDVSVDGISLGIAGTQSLTIGNWDSTLFFMVDPDLSTVLADGMISVTVQSGTGVNTGFTNALDQHHVRVFTNGEGWLSGDVPVTGILAGDSLTIPITFYSFGLSAGIYNSTITLATNDPATPTYDLPVTLNLTGTADYTLADSCIDFGTIIPGTGNVDTVTFTNIGCDSLLISSITSTSGEFTVLSFDNAVDIGQTGSILVEFNTAVSGSYAGNLNIVTNVQDTTICLSGIAQQLIGAFNVRPQDECSGLIAFADTSLGVPVSWDWDFGDGSTSNAQNPSHGYAALGDYTVTLIVCDATTCDTISDTITSNFLAFTEFYQITTTGALYTDTAIDFSVTGTNIIAVTWDFGDGGAGSNTTVPHTYTSSGTYIVEAAVITSGPCFESIFDTVVIEVNPDTGSPGDTIPDDTFALNQKIFDDLSIYPNPSNGSFFIDLDAEIGNNINLQILNSAGQEILTRENIKLNKYPVEIKDNGLYLIRITTKSGYQTERKVTIQK